MSSDMKDARWGLAYEWARSRGMGYEDFTYTGWQKLLDAAQRTVDLNPGIVEYWAARFRGEDA